MLVHENSRSVYVDYCTLFWFICQVIYTTIQDYGKICLNIELVTPTVGYA
jgi:hypothetical protein